ncbi:uncharacterized protein C13orf46 homolog [Microcebus murinus]|uniref:uncharacterized protein C13orf46 homolog n=1 Tax=Microcebus murinus TaxID=30608 RepID=UPI003F6C0D9A
MEKDGAAAGHRRHRPGPGALPAGAAAGHARTAGEVAELQRSRSVGGLHQKGDPPSCLRKPRKEPESEDPGKDPRSDVEDSSCQAEADAGEKEEGDLAQAEPAAGRTEPEPEKGGPEPSATGEPQGERGEQCGGEAKEPEPESVKLKDPEKEKPSVFVEIDLRDHAEEVATCAAKEEHRSRMDTGDGSEDEARTSWVCCIPYTTRRKVKDGA